MSLTDDDVVQLLGRLPSLNEAPEAARSEATVVVKRGQNAEKSGESERNALRAYLDALELDPGCKPAYDAIGKLLLAQKTLGKPALEAALRYFDVAQKRFTNDAALLDVAKRLRAQLSPGAAIEPALAKATGKLPPKPAPRASASPAASGPRRTCEYCGSPIPANAPSCRSCQMSGEIRKPEVEQMKAAQDRQKASHRLLVAMLVAVVVVAAAIAVAIFVRHHR